MQFSLSKILPKVKPQPSHEPRHYELAAHQLSTALGIPLEDAQGWVDAATRRQRGIRE